MINSTDDINKEVITKLLKDASTIAMFCETRALEKLDAEKRGFGRYNSIEFVSFHENNVYIQVVDSGYDLRDTDSVELSIDEISMSNKEWSEHIQSIKNETRFEEQRKEEAEKSENERREKLHYLELKNKYEGEK